jgi:arylsulfatase
MPSIDRSRKKAQYLLIGTDSLTAGRAAFITGQSPIRTGLTKVGVPGADLSLRPEDRTIADVLSLSVMCASKLGRNHLGYRDEFLPTAHGFDEFFANLCHLDAEPEPENPDYRRSRVSKEIWMARSSAQLDNSRRRSEDRKSGSAHDQTYGDPGRGIS